MIKIGLNALSTILLTIKCLKIGIKVYIDVITDNLTYSVLGSEVIIVGVNFVRFTYFGPQLIRLRREEQKGF